MSEWISVKDRLPTPNEKVLTYCCCKSLDTYSIEISCYYKGKWFVPSWIQYEVTHWQPLPKPPKKVGRKTTNFEKFKAELTTEEAAEITELPCKVGDIVYYICGNKIYPKLITQCREIMRSSRTIDKWYCLDFSDLETFRDKEIGVIIFLSKAEAENKLKGGKI